MPDPGRPEHDLEGLVDPDDRAGRVDHHHAVGQRLDDGGLAAVRLSCTCCSSRLRSVMSRRLTTIPPIGSSRWLAATSSRSIASRRPARS